MTHRKISFFGIGHFRNKSNRIAQGCSSFREGITCVTTSKVMESIETASRVSPRRSSSVNHDNSEENILETCND